MWGVTKNTFHGFEEKIKEDLSWEFSDIIFVSFFFFLQLTRGFYGFDPNQWPINIVLKDFTQRGV